MTGTPTVLIRTKQHRRNARSSRAGTPPSWLLIGAEITVPLLLLALWWLTSAGSSNTFFPPLQVILAQLTHQITTPLFWANIGASTLNLSFSFLLACVIGVLLGTLLGLTQWLAWLLEPVIHFFRAIPPVALVPIFVSLIGFGNETRVLSITLSAVFPVLISTIDGVRAIDPDRQATSRSYRLTPMQHLVSVVLPEASPRILSGMQVSLITAFVVMIASEMLGAAQGLGAWVLLAQQSFMIADMWGGMLVLGVLGYAATALLELARRRVLRWYIAIRQQEKQL